jgi:hypothetical protein
LNAEIERPAGKRAQTTAEKNEESVHEVADEERDFLRAWTF